MNNVKLTTKKTGMTHLIVGIIESLVFAGIGFYCLRSVDVLKAAWKMGAADTANTAGSLFLLIAFINLMYALLVNASYADVYGDKIVGKGIQMIALKDFDLNFNQISDISCSGQFLSINTPAGKYKVVTNASRAKEIFEYYNSIKNNIH